MNIRSATTQDIPVIHKLAHEIWWPTYRDILEDEQISFMLDKMYSAEALESQMNDGYKFLIVEQGNEPVGFAAYSLTDPENAVYKVQKIYVLPSQQGKGTGKKLISYVADLAKTKGGKILELNVNRGNPAFNFYKKLGFEIHQTVDIPFHQYVLNDYVMRKDL